MKEFEEEGKQKMRTKGEEEKGGSFQEKADVTGDPKFERQSLFPRK